MRVEAEIQTGEFRISALVCQGHVGNSLHERLSAIVHHSVTIEEIYTLKFESFSF